ncbi:unnamed protein product [Triticum turgidum subsp. durum]|uniref:Uncharacterized protein n=1 Tax=Triticum turgidum subsp. durum TaxID=4567 RepID=A0A9R1PFU8_TRITD|nr:unnamed protein product [Triticum turgidum subsp. durum]
MSARRFVNLLVSDCQKFTSTLRRFDLSRNQLFYPTPEEAAKHAKVVPPLTGMPNMPDLINNPSAVAVAGAGAEGKNRKKMIKKPVYIRLPAATVTMKPSICTMTPYDRWGRMYCFPLTETKLFFGDSSTRIFRFDAETHCIDTMPSLHTPKRSPLALSIPPNPATSEKGEAGALYIMDCILRPGSEGQVQFEAIVYRRRFHCSSKAWHCDALPPPPFVHDLQVGNKPASICSYAIVGGHTICISVRGVGTYCFDTVTREWSKAGDWLMPFHGKAEHDPGLGLWFGVSHSNFHIPCAADISGVVRGEEPLPEHTRIWADTDVPEGWYPHYRPAKVVRLGSGRFCVTNFFETKDYDCRCGLWLVDDILAVFTGIEIVLPSNGNGNDNDDGAFKGNNNGNGNNDNGECKGSVNGNGNGSPGVRMVKHKSRFCGTHGTNMILSVL